MSGGAFFRSEYKLVRTYLHSLHTMSAAMPRRLLAEPGGVVCRVCCLFPERGVTCGTMRAPASNSANIPLVMIVLHWRLSAIAMSNWPEPAAKRVLEKEVPAGVAAPSANERQSERQPSRTSQNPAGERSNGLLVVGRETITRQEARLSFSETDGLSDPHQSPFNLLNINDNFFCSSRISDP